MEARHDFTIRFADGGTLSLGPRTCVMGILNVTPDSFSDGGRYLDPSAATEAGAAMFEAGAAILDVGGESTRPGASAVDPAVEAERVLPVIEALKRHCPARISIDTMKASVARQAIDAGAELINDVSAFRDPEMLELASRRDVPVVLMHMRGTPATLQEQPHESDPVESVAGFLEDCVGSAVSAGVSDGKILVDPGIGFGKSVSGNLALLRGLPRLGRIGRPVVVGASRKSFIGKVLDLPADDRLEGSLAVAAYASVQGAHVIRAHDVTATVRTVRMIDAIRNS